MTKTYVIDTNVLLTDSEAIYKFQDNNVVIPITVIEEVDKFKKEQSEVGRNARQFARILDGLREKGRLYEGVKLDNGGTVKVALTMSRTLARLPYDLDDNIPDNRILSVAMDCGGILVSKDINLRVKADSVGVQAEDYKNSSIAVDEFYTGVGKAYVSEATLTKIYKEKKIDLYEVIQAPEPLYPNQCITLENVDNPKHTALTIYNSSMKEFRLIDDDLKVLGLTPKNSEQQYALSLLLDPNIKLVSLIGQAGSGKSLVACAAALHGILESRLYTKALLIKPIVAVGDSHQLGYLPGTLSQKLDPWLASYADSISYIMGSPEYEEPPKKTKKKNKDLWDDKSSAVTTPMEELMALGLLECGSIEHLRGRSLPNQIILVDEVQNLSPMVIKTILTRAGEGTKIFCIGDVSQTDLPYLNEQNNALVHVAEKFKNVDIAAHITLTKTVRSKLAEVAAEVL